MGRHVNHKLYTLMKVKSDILIRLVNNILPTKLHVAMATQSNGSIFFYHRQNVKLFLDTNGVRVLVDLVTLAHLHTQRAYVPLQTSALEASPDQQKDTEKEWYYNKDKEREGPFSYGEVSRHFTLFINTLVTCSPRKFFLQTAHTH